MSARRVFDRRRVLCVSAAAGMALAAAGLASPAVHPAAAEPKKPPGVTCPRPGGGEALPGDYDVIIVITFNDAGEEVGHERKKFICGEDGRWHEVIALRASGRRVYVVQTTYVRKRGTTRTTRTVKRTVRPR
jgi:hypothetical protein